MSRLPLKPLIRNPVFSHTLQTVKDGETAESLRGVVSVVCGCAVRQREVTTKKDTEGRGIDKNRQGNNL